MTDHDLEQDLPTDDDGDTAADRSPATALDAPAPPVGSRRPPTLLLVIGGIVAGVLLGLGAAAIVAGNDDDNDDESGAVDLAPVESLYPDDQAANAEAFLQAWARHRTATYRAELVLSRELTNGQQLEVARTVVQQPPRHGVRQAGSTTITGADESVSCEARQDGRVCTPYPGVDYNLEVANEIAAWRTAIGGDNPPYAIEASSAGCFELQLVKPLVEPPYGELTQVCFDDATGAMRSRQVVRANATEIEQATSITPTVTEADWQELRG